MTEFMYMSTHRENEWLDDKIEGLGEGSIRCNGKVRVDTKRVKSDGKFHKAVWVKPWEAFGTIDLRVPDDAIGVRTIEISGYTGTMFGYQGTAYIVQTHIRGRRVVEEIIRADPRILGPHFQAFLE